jgi:thiamine-phosphate pyrophosphorylase
VVVLTDRAASARPLAETAARCVAAGAGAVVLREKDLPRERRRALAIAIAAEIGTSRLVIASDAELARELGAAGVHLAWGERGAAGVVGLSCHSAAEVREAAALGATYATLSPIFLTPSKPGYGPALGPEALAGHPLPVYALGGIGPGRAGACARAGAAGVAIMGEAMRDPGSIRRVVEELAEVGW